MVMHMNRNSSRWRLPASYGIIALLAALSLGSLMLLALRSYYADQEHRYLLGNALALQPVLEQVLQSDAIRNNLLLFLARGRDFFLLLGVGRRNLQRLKCRR
jgi:hypothetical protein